jgi:hypothetical protein
MAEELEELVFRDRIERLLTDMPREADRGAHLVEIPPAPLALLQVGLEQLPLPIREGILEVVGDDLD